MGYQTLICYLAKFLVSILDPLTRNQFSLKNSLLQQSALQQTFRLKEPIHIAIFGIISLLTNISLDKTIELIYNMFFTISAIFH